MWQTDYVSNYKLALDKSVCSSKSSIVSYFDQALYLLHFQYFSVSLSSLTFHPLAWVCALFILKFDLKIVIFAVPFCAAVMQKLHTVCLNMIYRLSTSHSIVFTKRIMAVIIFITHWSSRCCLQHHFLLEGLMFVVLLHTLWKLQYTIVSLLHLLYSMSGFFFMFVATPFIKVYFIFTKTFMCLLMLYLVKHSLGI